MRPSSLQNSTSGNPVHAIFDSPMDAHGFAEQGCLGWQAADAIAALPTGLAGAISADEFPARFDHDQTLQSVLMLVLLLQPPHVMGHQTAPGFDPSVIFTGLDILPVQVIQLVCAGGIGPQWRALCDCLG
jgi:hypothetical protein